MYAKPDNGGVIGGNDEDEDIDTLNNNKFDRAIGGPNK